MKRKGKIPEIFDLQGKVALVTGAAGLLGSEYADALCQAGAHVVLADQHFKAGQKLAKVLTTRYGGQTRIQAVQVDISREASVRRMVERTLNKFGRIDILINNAALTVRGGTSTLGNYFEDFEEYPVALWNKALAVNLTGVFLCCQAVGRQMVKQESGVIVNISSTYGLVGPDHRIYEGIENPHDKEQSINTPIAYSVTKGGVVSLTRYLATYWAPKNIRVNTLTPGGVNENHDTRFVANYASRTPLGRMARREEYRGAILFLVSEASSYMTGANLVVDGGWTAW